MLEKFENFWCPTTGVVIAAAVTIAGMEAEARKPTTVEMCIFSKFRLETMERMDSVCWDIGCSDVL